MTLLFIILVYYISIVFGFNENTFTITEKENCKFDIMEGGDGSFRIKYNAIYNLNKDNNDEIDINLDFLFICYKYAYDYNLKKTQWNNIKFVNNDYICVAYSFNGFLLRGTYEKTGMGHYLVSYNLQYIIGNVINSDIDVSTKQSRQIVSNTLITTHLVLTSYSMGYYSGKESDPIYNINSIKSNIINFDWKQKTIELFRERNKFVCPSNALVNNVNQGDDGNGWCLVSSGENRSFIDINTTTNNNINNVLNIDTKHINQSYPLALHHYKEDTGLARCLSVFFHNKSVIDLGAGIGQYGRYYNFYDATISYEGFDGAYNVEEFTNNYIKWTDLSIDMIDIKPAQWVQSFEVSNYSIIILIFLFIFYLLIL
jgi:hypothetical protein